VITHCDSAEWLAHPGTVGRVVGNTTLQIVRDDGAEAAINEIGEVYMRRLDYPEFTYHGDPDKRQSIERNGLITNGDIGYLDEQGYLYLCDRARDMIISGGVNIYPAEIESALLGFQGVRDCAVLGIPDEEYGEAVMALVEPMAQDSCTESALRIHLKEYLAHYKIPRRIEFRQDLPREDSGKIFKRKLREEYWKDAGRNI
jgi:long-chain acyl-CoA synthetase